MRFDATIFRSASRPKKKGVDLGLSWVRPFVKGSDRPGRRVRRRGHEASLAAAVISASRT
jgi:hypothetical protein